ncbi:MAG: glutamate--tRNA ligase [Candidatus Zixiibacteriota bacterium]|nr:MAG: glutamate--tRNA ligase [candidate division Zixibacteria bacterium]
MNNVRVRIAPSPSGRLHIGTARAALFNWLFARNRGGKFLLRVEDTDESRSSKEMIDVIFNSLKWLGLDWDEEPIFQSKRLDVYNKYVEKLLESSNAYRCWCKPEVLKQKQEEARKKKITSRYDRHCLNLPDDKKEKLLDSGEPFAVRILIPEGKTVFNDLIVGETSRDNSEIDDFIIARSDGRAVYNLAVVVDDHEMGISHVIRGNDHITNTYKQILIYKALSLEPPRFAHIPLILGKDRSKMSKRDGAAGITDYEKMGYMKEAVVNFIALLGWSPGDDREIMTVDEMIESFSLDRINPSNAILDMEKLNWMNGEYIRACDNNRLIDLIRPFLIEAGLTTHLWINSRWEWMLKFVSAMKERCKLLTDFAEQGRYFFVDKFDYEEKGALKYFGPESAGYLKRWLEIIGSLERFDVVNLETSLRGLSEGLGIKPAALIHPTRLALTGTTKGPSLFDLMELFGQQECMKRLTRAIDFIGKIDKNA